MVDIQKAEQAIRDLLIAIGEDPDRPGLLETPKRCARMYEELLSGMGRDAEEHLSKQFDVDHPGFLLEKDIPFYSLCEHHLLPSMAKPTSPICQRTASPVFPSWHARWKSTPAVCSCRNR